MNAPISQWDWKNPDYATAFRVRTDNYERLIGLSAGALAELKAYYKLNPADFIHDWGITFDPRNAERGLPTIVPFLLFPKQREWIDFVITRWRQQEPGLVEKSRDMGVTWLAVGLSCALCLHYDGLAIGVGSRKGEYVDKIGSFKPILPKGRMFMDNLPAELRGGYVSWRDSPYMRISFPETGSIISGEFGDDIGRGDRASIYFVDEAAHLERPELVEASLSQTTNCRIDMSSVRGMANPFAQKRWSGKVKVFVFDWRDDPRKDQAWYDKQAAQLDPVVVAQEIDRDYQASVKGVVVPGPWVRSAIDAHVVLGLAPFGRKGLFFDVADEGTDKDAFCRAEGIVVEETDEWSGKGSDIFESVELIFEVCDDHGYTEFRYDSDGLGAGVRGDARVINERRQRTGAKVIKAIGYRGSEAVYDPEGIVEGTIGLEGDAGRMNADFFANRKAQAWWSIRKRFQKTHRWVEAVKKLRAAEAAGDGNLVELRERLKLATCGADEIISLSSKNPLLHKLTAEMSQATYRQNDLGKIVIEKKPNGMKSPNMADSVVGHYAPMEGPAFEVTSGVLQQLAAAGGGRRR